MRSAVCIGETMAMVTPTHHVPLERAEELFYGVGGAESNVALGLAVMGMDTHWISRVGADGFGTRILGELASHGVGTTGVQVDPTRNTGLYVKVPAHGDSPASVLYYRRHSAASAMSPELLKDPAVASLLAEAGLIHLSGITPALSPECRDMVHALLSAPRGPERLVSFDVNWRPALWAGRDHSALRELANLADIVLVGADEAVHAFGTAEEERLRELLPDPETIVIKNDDAGAVILRRGGERIEVPALRVEVLEPVGAGDAFAAGYLSGVMMGLDPRSSLRRGHLSAACTLTVRGDRGTLPEAAILDAVLSGSEEDWAATRVSAEHGISSPALAVRP
ncbi:sugar kinase [Mycetocola spongiae]|uniref:sugar kinase n=1 Tax=Mycetocola spongiae TaxID=2859226 RepID=UPI001CF52CE0|nr:sugar kinase [Mycetocola spongiae]UCR87923.1 sugar kinase [Mycetocola spongiae]